MVDDRFLVPRLPPHFVLQATKAGGRPEEINFANFSDCEWPATV